MTTAAAGHLVECKECHATGIVADGQNVHDGLDCKCCPTSTHTHAAGDGWNPQRTEGAVCRNVVVHVNAVLLPVIGGAS